jgi:zinc transporter ZupT
MPDGSFVGLAASTLLAAGSASAGVLIISRLERWGRRNSAYFTAFAAGLLITVSLLHLAPKALSMNADAAGLLVAGFFAVYLSDRLVGDHHPEGERTGRSAVVPVLAIGYHSLVDGMIYSVTFSIGAFTGWLTAVGMILHEFPEGVVAYALLQRSGVTRSRAVLWAILATAVSTPAGAFIAYPFVDHLGDRLLGALLAVAAGALLYVGAGHLLPDLEHHEQKGLTLAVAGGVALAALFILASHA